MENSLILAIICLIPTKISLQSRGNSVIPAAICLIPTKTSLQLQENSVIFVNIFLIPIKISLQSEKNSLIQNEIQVFVCKRERAAEHIVFASLYDSINFPGYAR